jgi:putative ABC transport system permease protein
MFIVSGIMIVPINLLNTMKSKEFISYMGSSNEDIIIEVDAGVNLDKNYETIRNILAKDSDIKEYNEFRSVLVEALDSDEQWMNLHVDSGNNAGEGLKYLTGKAPETANEIALSMLNADTAGKKTGDSLIIRYNDSQKEFVISGIYQDVTSGGYTAKAVNDFPGMMSEKYQLTVNLVKGTNAENKAEQWKDESGSGSDILPMQEYINQTLGGVSRQVEIAVFAVVIIGMALAALLVVLFMKLRLAKDMAQIAAMKAIGFTDSDIRIQYLCKIGMISMTGILVGTIISNFLGENLVSVAFGMMGLGITRITFIINPWVAFLLIPVILLAFAAGMTLLSSRQIRNYNIISLINE